MADINISQLPELVTPALDDHIHTIDRSANQDKRTSPLGLFNAGKDLNTSTSPGLANHLIIYVGNTPVRITLANFLKFFGQLNQVANPELNDRVAIYDIDIGAASYITINSLLSEFNSLTPLPTAASNDYYMVWDSSVNSLKRIKAEDVVSNNSITASKLASGAVTNSKLANSAVSGVKIATGAVTSSKLGSGSATNTKLASNAVSTAKIANNAVTPAKVDHDVLGGISSYSTNQFLDSPGADFKTHRLTGSTARTFHLPVTDPGISAGIWLRFVNDSTENLTISADGQDRIDGLASIVVQPTGTTTIQLVNYVAVGRSDWRQVGGGSGGGTFRFLGSQFLDVTSSTDDMWMESGIVVPGNWNIIAIYSDNEDMFLEDSNPLIIPKSAWDAASTLTVGGSSTTGHLNAGTTPYVGKGSGNRILTYSSSSDFSILVYIL